MKTCFLFHEDNSTLVCYKAIIQQVQSKQVDLYL